MTVGTHRIFAWQIRVVLAVTTGSLDPGGVPFSIRNKDTVNLASDEYNIARLEAALCK